MAIIRELFFFGPSVSAVRTEFLTLGTNHSEGSESNDKQDVRGRIISGVMLITRGRGAREGEGGEKRLSGAQFSAVCSHHGCMAN